MNPSCGTTHDPIWFVGHKPKSKQVLNAKASMLLPLLLLGISSSMVAVGDDVEEPKAVRQHRKKRALKNKSLAVSFNEKDLKDYVTGFHKRKKKRRKEAQKQQEDALRRKRNEERKKRKLERELVHGGGVPPTADDPEPDKIQAAESITRTKTYESADLKVTVVTSEISPEEASHPNERKEPGLSFQPVVADKKHTVPINNRKPFKKVVKQWSRPKPAREIKGKEIKGVTSNKVTIAGHFASRTFLSLQ